MGKRWQAGGGRSGLGERAYQKIPAVEEVRLERDQFFGLLAVPTFVACKARGQGSSKMKGFISWVGRKWDWRDIDE